LTKIKLICLFDRFNMEIRFYELAVGKEQLAVGKGALGEGSWQNVF
jgi:hypothetical protein